MAQPGMFHADGTPCAGDTCAWQGAGGHKAVHGTVCPRCGSGERLYDIDLVEVMTGTTVDPDTGHAEPDSTGGEVLWETSQTRGIYCRGCDWSFTGDLGILHPGAVLYTDLLVSPKAFELHHEENERRRVEEARREALAKMKEIGF